ncbi:LOW QUALITY PROTEIN: programmed cell death 1 ligand 1 [Phaethornis superciliosus]
MEKPLILYIFLFYWHFLNALFTVEAPLSLYTVEHGNNVTMECTFPVHGKLEFRDLSVSWEKKDELKKQVYALIKGVEDFKNQHSDFKGRIKLLKENLKLGRSVLQITDVKLRDAGFYRCAVGYGGADYKTIRLKVKAPYRTITQGVVSPGDDEWKLMCQSEGYPQAEVIWQNKEYEDLTYKANTSYETGSDELYRVTSTLTIKSRVGEIFYCIFWNKELQENTSAILHLADSVDGVLWTESRRFVGAILIVTVLFGSVSLFITCIRKARANKDDRTPVPSSSIAKLSNDNETYDCRDACFEEQELKYQPEKMFQILTIMLLEMHLCAVSALFTVDVPQQLYIAEYGGNMTMECRFPVNDTLPGALTVVWEQKRQSLSKSKEMYTFHNGKVLSPSQHRLGRAELLHRELKLGQDVLQITRVKITDMGSYLCLTDCEGVNYKYIILKAKASYKRINTQVMRKPGEDKFVFMCQSEGFPVAEVFWQNKYFSLGGSANTTYTLTADGLYNITSILIFKPNMSESYSCVFWNKELNEETPAHISPLSLMSTQHSGQKSLFLFIIPTCVVVAVLLSALVISQKRKSVKNGQSKKGDDFHSQPGALYLSAVMASGDSGSL